MPVCPECRDGKTNNCVGIAINPDTDEFVECGTQIKAIIESEENDS